ncbi:PREDICTED: kunitz-type serine protease inhibitor nigrescinin-1-like, partial [Gekko japonicus]|uniref:Kunitz-type serine protease inhibitor nigrescinin-1-like n=1 Tax=Gekko japonicus TaxID=146911 RepID=A0ABM1KNQ1_GEKJA
MEVLKEHPGVCPLREEVKTLAPCNDTCSDDRDCLPNQKCCFNGCSLSCLDSVRRKECRLPAERGPCTMAFVRYYYNVDQKRCIQFTYGGCHGNSNNFETKEECKKSCGKITP